MNYDEFLLKMKLSGYEIKQGKHLAFRPPEQKNFAYMKSLGNYYTEDSVQDRLNRNRHKTVSPKNISRKVRLFVVISAFIESGNQKGVKTWAKRNNLKQAALTLNYLSENNLLNYEDFQQHIIGIDNSIVATEQRISELISEISRQELIQKQCSSYRTCRKIVKDAKTTSDPQKYKTIHQSEYKLHDTLKQQLQELGITKLPSPERLQKKIDNLRNERSSASKEKQALEKKRSTLNTITTNFNTLLSNDAHFKNISEHGQEEHTL